MGNLLSRITSTIKSSVFSGVAANLFGVSSNLLAQLISVPVLSHAFGLELYGVWLLIMTIPAYVALTDVGFTVAATSDMAMNAANDRHERVQATFQSVLLLTSMVSAMLVLLVAGIVGTLSWLWPMALGSVEAYRVALIYLTVYAGLTLVSRVPIAALRANRHFARGTVMLDSATFLENVAMMVVATVTRSLTATVFVAMAIRLVAMVGMYFEMHRLLPHLHVGIGHASMAEVRRLMKPALAAASIPAAVAVNLQGTTLAVGAMLGPAAVAVFVSTRTASRLAVQMFGVLSRALVPELSAAHARGDSEREAALWRINRRSVQIFLIPAAIGFAVLGVPAISFWTHGLIVPPITLVVLMAGCLAFHCIWYFQVTLATAIHRHGPMAKHILWICCGSIVLGVAFMPKIGVSGAGLSVLLADIALTVICSRLTAKIYRQHKAGVPL